MTGKTPLETIESARAFFQQDRFATDNGMVIAGAEEKRAVVTLELRDIHRNAAGGVMGGVLFTMADFACAVAANFGPRPDLYVSVDSHISFLSGCKGDTLTAEATCEKNGRNLAFFTVVVSDNVGTTVASARFTMYRVA